MLTKSQNCRRLNLYYGEKGLSSFQLNVTTPLARYIASRKVQRLSQGTSPLARYTASHKVHCLSQGTSPLARYNASRKVNRLSQGTTPLARYIASRKVHCLSQGTARPKGLNSSSGLVSFVSVPSLRYKTNSKTVKQLQW